MSAADPPLWAAYDAMGEAYAAHATDGVYNAYYDRPAMLTALGDVRGLRVLDLSMLGFNGDLESTTLRACLRRTPSPVWEPVETAVAVRVVGDTLTLLGPDDETLAVFTRSSAP